MPVDRITPIFNAGRPRSDEDDIEGWVPSRPSQEVEGADIFTCLDQQTDRPQRTRRRNVRLGPIGALTADQDHPQQIQDLPLLDEMMIDPPELPPFEGVNDEMVIDPPLLTPVEDLQDEQAIDPGTVDEDFDFDDNDNSNRQQGQGRRIEWKERVPGKNFNHAFFALISLKEFLTDNRGVNLSSPRVFGRVAAYMKEKVPQAFAGRTQYTINRSFKTLWNGWSTRMSTGRGFPNGLFSSDLVYRATEMFNQIKQISTRNMLGSVDDENVSDEDPQQPNSPVLDVGDIATNRTMSVSAARQSGIDRREASLAETQRRNEAMTMFNEHLTGARRRVPAATTSSSRTSNFDRVSNHLEQLNGTIDDVNQANESLNISFNTSMTTLMRSQIERSEVEDRRNYEREERRRLEDVERRREDLAREERREERRREEMMERRREEAERERRREDRENERHTRDNLLLASIIGNSQSHSSRDEDKVLVLSKKLVASSLSQEPSLELVITDINKLRSDAAEYLNLEPSTVKGLMIRDIDGIKKIITSISRISFPRATVSHYISGSGISYILLET